MRTKSKTIKSAKGEYERDYLINLLPKMINSGYSQRLIAEKLGIKQPTVSKLLSEIKTEAQTNEPEIRLDRKMNSKDAVNAFETFMNEISSQELANNNTKTPAEPNDQDSHDSLREYDFSQKIPQNSFSSLDDLNDSIWKDEYEELFTDFQKLSKKVRTLESLLVMYINNENSDEDE